MVVDLVLESLNTSKLAFQIASIRKTKYFCHSNEELSMWAFFKHLHVMWFVVVHI